METRRSFLARSGGLLAGMTAVARPAVSQSPACVDRARLALRAEVPRIRFELHVFEYQYLPALLAPRRLTFPAGVATLAPQPERHQECGTELEIWQLAVRRLAAALPRMGGRRSPAPLDAAELLALPNMRWWADLLLPSRRCYAVADWPPVRWLNMPMPCSVPEEKILAEIRAWAQPRGTPFRTGQVELHGLMPAIKRKFFQAPVDFNTLARRYATWLPVLAPHDSDFVAKALDIGMLVRLLGRDAPQSLQHGMGDFLASVVSCSIANCMAALAANHFLQISRLLHKPEAWGNWRGFMPGSIAVVLFRKVTGLRQLLADIEGENPHERT